MLLLSGVSSDKRPKQKCTGSNISHFHYSSRMREESERELLLRLFESAVQAVSAEQVLKGFLPVEPAQGETLVIGAGKAAAAMAEVAARTIPGRLTGLVVTRYGHGLPSPRRTPSSIECIEAGHPVPDAAAQQAANRMLALVRRASPGDRIVFLLSGGASSLLPLPAAGLSLDDKRELTRSLLECGARIDEINCVRRHLSAIKGGRLARATTVPILTLAISDVPGDDPVVIGSGPTVPDPTTLADARSVLARYRLSVPDTVAEALETLANETPKPAPHDELQLTTRIVATARDALAAAAAAATAAGYEVVMLGDTLEGEARTLGAAHGELAKAYAQRPGRWLLLSGGETTVRVAHRTGRGGRNLEYLAGLALALDGHPRIHALACDTDGIDGTEDNAGALLLPATLAMAAAKGFDARDCLARNRTYDLFASCDALVVTGPTRTNVNDFRAVLIDAR
jgi:glycerate 2-kinase